VLLLLTLNVIQDDSFQFQIHGSKSTTNRAGY